MEPVAETYDYDDFIQKTGDYDFEDDEVADLMEPEEYDEEQLAQQQQLFQRELQLQQQQAVEQLPDAVRNFILYFHFCLKENNVYELHGCYENTFNRLTEKFYKNTSWPDPHTIANLVNNDPLFLGLYTEMYYRHIYAKLQPSLEDRFVSYANYCDLFNYIFKSPTSSLPELPINWAWDIIDEFIYQFNSFALFRSRAIKKAHNDEEVQLLLKHSDTWNTYSVLNVLYSFTQKSRMKEQLQAMKEGRDPDTEVAGEDGQHPLYKTLGYFSIIGLLRVHTLLGDFTLALKTMEGIDLSKKNKFSRVASVQFTIYYYVGFCYMMLRRYADAIKAFSHILLYIARTKNFHNRSAQYDAVSKRSDQMYALLTICVALCPTRLDDSIHTTLREKNGEQLARLQRGGPETLPIYEELFCFACPKFMPVAPLDSEPLRNADSLQHHLKVFMADVQNSLLAPTLRSYLKLYTTMDLEKLATFLEMDPNDLRAALVVFKQKSQQLRWKEGSDSLLDGETIPVSDLDIVLDRDTIHIVEAKIGRKFGDWFLRNTAKYYVVQDALSSKHPQKVEQKERYKDKKRERREKNPNHERNGEKESN
ncbi:RNA polymerase I-associated factor PAF67-domain-containing protein [Dipodascopsis tothii]|uniref:RNA polymerase I-associated factor PAF67-domain-containing protein n=1 Tax=Dipodascopsis tothii TaxID=44089 RepID=UPI0034CDC5C9